MRHEKTDNSSLSCCGTQEWNDTWRTRTTTRYLSFAIYLPVKAEWHQQCSLVWGTKTKHSQKVDIGYSNPSTESRIWLQEYRDFINHQFVSAKFYLQTSSNARSQKDKRTISNAKIQGILKNVLANLQDAEGFSFCNSVSQTLNLSMMADKHLEFPTHIFGPACFM